MVRIARVGNLSNHSKSPRKRIFGWGINDTLRKRSRYEDENESLLIENSAQDRLSAREKKN